MKKNQNTLVIDAQLFQTNTWNRGMGKYSLHLLASLQKESFLGSFAKVLLVLNKNYDLDPAKRQTLEEHMPDAAFVELDLCDTATESGDIAQAQEKNAHIIDAYMSDNNIGYQQLILSVFEDRAVASFGHNSIHNMVLFYDLIPYLFSDQYLVGDKTKSDYFSKLAMVYKADQLFAISDTTRKDIVSYFGIDSARVINIDGAPITLERSNTKPRKPAGVDGAYILLPSGNDIRKNNKRAIEAFEQFNAAHDNKYSLVITSTFDKKTQKILKGKTKKVCFVGNVDEAEIQWLYLNAASVFFPPLYEGLGLPILEAVDTKQPIACSRIGVFQEMAGEGVFHYFDPYNTADMAEKLAAAVSSKAPLAEYRKVQKKYQWTNTAKALIAGYTNKVVRAAKEGLPRVAVVGPSPYGLSTIAKVIQGLHPSMSEVAEVDYYLENNESEEKKLALLEQKIAEEEKRLKELQLLNLFVSPPVDVAELSQTEIEKTIVSAQRLMSSSSRNLMITGRHQLVVEVLQAYGLSPESLGSCDPYAEVRLLSSASSRRTLFMRRDIRMTYYVRKSTNPEWRDQRFLFEVPPDAVKISRGHSIQVRLRGYRAIGRHHILGKVQLDLHSFRNQEPLGKFSVLGVAWCHSS